MTDIKIKLTGGMMPEKKSEYAACYDLFCPEDFVISYGRQVIDLGFVLELPVGWHADIRPRSGFSAKGFECKRIMFNVDGDRTVNHEDIIRIDADVILGTIDSDFRNNCGVILMCHEPTISPYNVPYIERFYEDEYMIDSFIIPKGTRIAQMLIARDEEEHLVEVDEIDMTNDRGGGFGHTGTN